VVTICTTRFNIQKFYVLRAQYIYVFCSDIRTNSDYLYTQLTYFQSKAECVYCAVRSDSLNTFPIQLALSKRTKKRSLGTFPKAMLFRQSCSTGQRINST